MQYRGILRRVVAVAFPASYASYAYYTEDHWLVGPRRGCVFWATAFPLLARYKWRDIRGEVLTDLHEEGAQKAIDLILRLQGFYIKVGQFLSTRPEIMPDAYIQKLRPLRDRVPARPISEIRPTIEQDLQQRLEDIFQSFDEVPLGAASIGQVHRAVQKDGSEVCVKVQYDEVHRQFHVDLMCVTIVLGLVEPSLRKMLLEMKEAFMLEFDYNNEARNLSEIAVNMSRAPFARKVCVPAPIRSTRKVLIMEFLVGRSLEVALLDDIGNIAGTKKDAPLNEMCARLINAETPDLEGERPRDLDKPRWNIFSNMSLGTLFQGWRLVRWTQSWWKPPVQTTAEIVELLLQVHGHQIFVDGCFQADPHPGNFLLMDDGRIGLIDFGQTKRLDRSQRQRLGALVKAVAEERDVLPAMHTLGVRTLNSDPLFCEMIAIYLVGSLKQVSRLIARERGSSSRRELREFYYDMRQRDQLVDLPKELYLPVRSATLLRGLGLLLGHYVNPAASWSVFVEPYE